jgi:citrate synthase
MRRTEMTTAEYVPGLAGVVATKSGISDIDGQRGILKYRGYAIQELAEKSTFEESAYLTIEGELPTKAQLAKFDSDLRHHRRLKFKITDMIKWMPEYGFPMEALQAAVAVLGMFYPKDIDDPEVNYESGVRLIAKLPTIVAAFHRVRNGDEPLPPRDDLDHASNFLYMMNGEAPDELVAKVFDVCLILHIEHTINASTFSAMVTGSTLADPYTVISSAIGTLSGRLHGGANERVLKMLREIGTVENARPYIEQKIANKELIMGMGHREYKTMDPRATILTGLNQKLFEKLGPTPLFDIAKEVEKTVIEKLGEKGVWPNVDFYSGIAYDKMGIPVDVFTPVFAISRVAGWVAHWREQIADNRIFRPTQIYVGSADRNYDPIEKRG